MTFRSKFLAATLGLVIASGAIGSAFAETTPVAAPKTAVTAPKTAVTAPIAKTTKTVKVATKHHRLHVAHRGIKGKLVAHRGLRHAKLAKITKIGRTHVALSHAQHGKIAKRHLVRSHLVRVHVAKRLVGTKHAMIAKKSVIR